MSDTPSQEPSDDPTHESYIGDDELLMRRMLYKNKQYNPHSTPPILAGAFHPRKVDRDGLSLSRRHSEKYPGFLTAEQMKSACAVQSARDRRECGVCAVVVESVREIGMTIVLSRTDDDPGHVHLDQIKYKDFEGVEATDESFDKIAIWISRLVQLACKNILIEPGPPPAPSKSAP